jgi:myosin-crossreactive antigen
VSSQPERAVELVTIRNIQKEPCPERKPDDNAAIYLVGGGIASLAAAAFFIRDGDIPGRNITILEESGRIGGSLDAAGTPETATSCAAAG